MTTHATSRIRAAGNLPSPVSRSIAGNSGRSHSVRMILRSSVFLIPLLATATAAHADLVISTAATSQVTCTGTTCSATAKNAVLNVSQLESLLASSAVKVVSGKKAGSIDVSAALAWASSNPLTLDAYQSITINKAVNVNGSGALALVTDDGGTGGTLSFGAKGNIAFLGLSNSLTINGASYTLVNRISTLASDIASNPAGNYALAGSYNAKSDGKYSSSPIGTTFTGSFEGLGNTISNLTIKDTANSGGVGLFAEVGAGGVVRDVGVINSNVSGGNVSNKTAVDGIGVGELVGFLLGSVVNCYSTGSSTVGNDTSTPNGGLVADAGGLVGGIDAPGALVDNSYSTATVTGGNSAFAGGLVGAVYNGGTVEFSHASGNVAVGSNSEGGAYSGAVAGGLIGLINNSNNPGPADIVTNDYATGTATAGADSTAGGLVGAAGGPATIKLSYATGAVSIGAGVSTSAYAFGGGLVGFNYTINNIGDTIDQSFATGAVTGAPFAFVGGLVGYTTTSVTNSYSTGTVSATGSGFTGLGGLSGDIDTAGTVGTSYSTGTVQPVGGSYYGGFVGNLAGTLSNNYWDTTTSGLGNAAGNVAGAPGATGDTTSQMQSSLPSGFSSSIWGENSGINGGLPYLLANPPPA